MNASAKTLNLGSRGKRLFASFLMGGFECSTHRLKSGRRLDIIASTQHDRWCGQDYARLRQQGMSVAREGLRWHLIEATPGHYDFASAEPIVAAAGEQGMQILWDICHYGWPDDIDIFTPEFVDRYARFAAQAASWLAERLPGPHFFAPINEISFFSWAGGDVPHLNPYCEGRGFELKCQLVRAAIAGMRAIRRSLPKARFLQIDPLVHIVPKANRPQQRLEAEGYRTAQYQAFDLLAGRLRPELGGEESFLDIIGLNFYPNNEWVYKGRALARWDPAYRPLRDLLLEVFERYARPMFIAETGTEGRRRPGWFRYVANEVRAAMDQGIPMQGICLYPVVNHPGWINERHCHNGLWDYPDAAGARPIYSPLARELDRARPLFEPASSEPLPEKSVVFRSSLEPWTSEAI